MSPEELRILRRRLGLTQAQFAERWGVSTGLVTSIELGRCRFTERRQREIARIFPAPRVKMTANLHSVPVKLLQREIKKIAARINRCASMDDLDRAWATLRRLQHALALATERAKALAD